MNQSQSQSQSQSSSVNPVNSSASSAKRSDRSGQPLTSELIQSHLDENQLIIAAILENQNLGKLQAALQYQLKLQQNLLYLAAMADQQ